MNGYTGKLLFVDLNLRQVRIEELDAEVARNYIGGYGLGARIVYERQPAAVDALGPDNYLGFTTGPLTGTPALSSPRFTVVGKSPLTGGWGDSNSGGDFGPYLKFAGFDAVFIRGVSETPVYLLVKDGQAVVKDAAALWGADTYHTEAALRAEHGADARVCSIGPAGEKRTLLAGIITRRGSAAARSGLGAVMGSKKLKAVVACGNQSITLADGPGLKRANQEFIAHLRSNPMMEQVYLGDRRRYGTTGWTERMLQIGSSPVKNWGGSLVSDFADYSGLTAEAATANQVKVEGCWRCAMPCKGVLGEGPPEYPYEAGVPRPEYETQIAFGPMCLNNHTDSINMVNDICNRHGIDTISTGSAVAFAIECFENDMLTTADTDGLEMRWGDHRMIVALTEKIARREGFGAVLADGVKLAAERIGRGAEKFAVHVGGQEPGMHDPKLISAALGDMPSAARYQMDATPGRHTQGFGPSSFRGHVVSAAGLCTQGGFQNAEASAKFTHAFMAAVTGWDRDWDDLLLAGERIMTLRHLFNLREGINPLDRPLPARMRGEPPLKSGPHAGVTADIEAQIYWNLGALDWDRQTTRPSSKKLRALGLTDFAAGLTP